MAEDKLYMIDSAGFTLAGLKKRKPAFFGGVIGCMAEIAVGRLLFVLSHAASQGERSGTDAGRSGHNRLSAHPKGTSFGARRRVDFVQGSTKSIAR